MTRPRKHPPDGVRAAPKCPECECDKWYVALHWLEGGDFCFVIWPIYSRYDWWKCPQCKRRFVTNEDGEPELAAEGVP